MKNKIRIERARKELTQEQLAKLANVSRQTIHAIENGKYVPSTILALKIARILECSMEGLFELEEIDWK